MRIIIIGAGEVGFHIARRLAAENKDVVIIDRNEEVLERVAERLDVETVLGSGSSPRVLEAAGVKNAQIMLAVTDSDEINLIACTFSNILAPRLTKVARIRNPEYTDYKDILASDLHIDIVINPEQEVIGSIERLMGTPGAAEVSEFSDVNITLAGLWIRENCPLAGMTLADLKQAVGVARFIVAAIVRGESLIIPAGSHQVLPGDMVYFVCAHEDVQEVLTAFGASTEPQHKVLIIGGGNIGFKLAQSLEQKKGLQIKIMDSDRERCEFLAHNLSRTIVLQGEGSDQRLLTEENVGSMDVVISVTGDEENNVLCSLLAKSLGARLTVTRINKFAYLPLIRAVGLEHIVSPRLSAANSILRHVRHGTVISSISIKEDAEAMEVVAREDSPLVGRPIKDLDFPSGAIVLCLVRGEEVIIPTGESVIQPQDRVMIMSTSKHISDVEKKIT
ncbi:Trk system potassium transporter TrkA [Desulfovermiculus halophilus]|jgi:trk system potassium uptake protein TrkA|uniref:Trk system potassium transporter TrkA n=1 Tax=Desulfovermiculus halophilus TaxID=339722 RepID=UPI0004840D3B|nr:Trk system potassium transporter TrkA [Desulfovermiculus halophilus]